LTRARVNLVINLVSTGSSRERINPLQGAGSNRQRVDPATTGSSRERIKPREAGL